ncbi:MAG: hypothetical protein Q4G09_05875 [Clostridia bacterium]|nr:hypothetical protein [Clostridia bacterium]
MGKAKKDNEEMIENLKNNNKKIEEEKKAEEIKGETIQKTDEEIKIE